VSLDVINMLCSLWDELDMVQYPYVDMDLQYVLLIIPRDDKDKYNYSNEGII
jgi:hypothetical protein